jgi:hypothetical protein
VSQTGKKTEGDDLGEPIQVRLRRSDESELEKITRATGLPKAEVIRRFVAAGARAVARDGYRLSLPLTFTVTVSGD